MLVKILSYIPSIIGLSLVGFFVLANNPKDIRNKTFAFCNFFIASWLFFLFLADTTSNELFGLWYLRFALFFGEIMFLFFYYFTLVFPFRSSISQKRVVLYSLPLLVVAVLLLTPLGVSSVTIKEFGVQPDDVGPLYAISDILGIIYLLIGSLILILKYKKSDQKQKKQIKFVLSGLILAAIVNIVTGFVLTLFKIDTDAILFGGVSLFVFSLFVAYSMIRHGFMDIRLIVARSLGYVISLSLIVISTLALVYMVSSSAIADSLSQNTRAFIYAIFVVGLAIVYQPVKKWFDNVTNQIFFRDAYDTQALLDELNQTLVSTIDVQKLLSTTSDILQKYLKADFATFAIREGEEDNLRFFGSENFTKRQDINTHRPLLLDHGSKVIVTNLLEDDQKQLKRFLFDERIDLLARLTADPQVEGVGYLLLGEKKSGNPYTSQDIGVIEIVGNELVIAIQNALQFEEIQRFNVTLQEKIDTATRQLKRSNEKLKSLDETKDEFISMASHQLRTPLTSVKGYMSMVLEGDAGKINANQRKLLSQAFISSQRMVYLIADLLNVSRLKTGKFIIEPMPTNLADVIEGEVDQLKETAAARELTLAYKKPKDFPSLMLDETKTRQVIMNFMDNALHYTPNGGHITVGLVDKGDSIEYTVSDNGIGVPKGDQHHLFTKFYRAGNAQQARPDGTGLGLFMAKKVIIAQNGTVIFRSQVGKGSTFGFNFQKSKLPKAAPVKAPPDKEK